MPLLYFWDGIMEKPEYYLSLEIWDNAKKDSPDFLRAITTEDTNKIIALLQRAIKHMKQK